MVRTAGRRLALLGALVLATSVAACGALEEPGALVPPTAERDRLLPQIPLEIALVRSKRFVDVTLVGALKLPTSVEAVDVTLGVGRRIRKTLRITGDRRWKVGILRVLVPSDPEPWARMPAAWERCWGGSDPRRARRLERRNPVGCGCYSDVEDAADDFDPTFYNSAPPDQRLDGYVPGEEVSLEFMTERVRECFSLPPWTVPVTFADARLSPVTIEAVPDTVQIDPEKRTVDLTGRCSFVPYPDISSVRAIVGPVSRGQLRALSSGKAHHRWKLNDALRRGGRTGEVALCQYHIRTDVAAGWF